METEERGKLIGQIILEIRLFHFPTPVDCGDLFFKLAFLDDEQLMTIGRLCGINSV